MMAAGKESSSHFLWSDRCHICMHCTEGPQQQGGKECAGGFHCAISDSNAIRKQMEMFL